MRLPPTFVSGALERCVEHSVHPHFALDSATTSITDQYEIVFTWCERPAGTGPGPCRDSRSGADRPVSAVWHGYVWRCRGTRGQVVLQVAEERLDRGEPRIAGADRVAAFALQGVEEVQYQRCRQLLDDKVARSDAKTFGSEAREHLEGVCVALDGTRARPPIAGHGGSHPGVLPTASCRTPPSCRCSAKFVVHPILFTPFALPRYCGMPDPSAPVDGLFDPRQADAADSFHFPVELFASARVTRIATMRLTTGSPTGSPVSAVVVHARLSAGKPIVSYLDRQRARLQPKTRQRALAPRRHDAQSYKTLTRRRFRSLPRNRTRTRSAGRLTVLRAAAAGRSLRPTLKPDTDRQRVSARDAGPSIRPTDPSQTRPWPKPRQPASHRVAGARCPQRRHSESCPSRGRSHAPSPTHSPQA